MGTSKIYLAQKVKYGKAHVCIGEYILEQTFRIMKQDSQQLGLKLSKVYHESGKRMCKYECIKSWKELPGVVDQLNTIHSIQINAWSLYMM